MDKILEFNRRVSVGERLAPAPSYSHPVTFHYEIQHHTTRMQKLTRAFKVYRLTVLTLICVIAGLAVGLLSRPYAQNWSERQFMYIEMPGELYLRLLKLMIMPLLVSNVILSFGTIQGKLSSRLGKVASFLYLGSNLMAITVAIVLALLIGPGRHESINLNNLVNVNQLQMDKHHYFNEYHNSIKRYREYHPMFYHTDHGKQTNDAYIVQPPYVKPSRILLIENSSVLEVLSTDETKLKSAQGDSAYVVKQLFLNNRTCDTDHVHRIGLNTKLPIDVVLDILRNIVPDNIVGATLQQTRTRLFAPKELVIGTNGTTNPPPSSWPMGHEMVDQANIIGLLAISVLIGVVLSHMEEASKPMLDLCACISELSLRVGMIAINLTPFCIMFLLIGQVARTHDLSSVAGELCMYSVTVLLALAVHGFVLLPLVYYLITKKSPVEFLLSLLETLVASFATSSSSASMALMLNCLTELELNPVIVRAFGPLGSVFNMNGTAIYEAIAAIFIAQTLGITLPLTSLLLVGLSSAVASLSTSGIPSSGMMTMVIVLNAINLPVLELSLIYIVDFIIDRFRTVINVWSSAIACALINHICPEQLFEIEMKPEKYREMIKFRGSRGTLTNTRKSLSNNEENAKPQVISVTITPPLESSCV